MDNLTHSLIGAVLGQAGLKRQTGLAMPTLIIAANIPDIDAACTIYGTLSLAMRRGLTHGPIAMLLLPLLLTAAMMAFDRWQALRGKRPPGRPPVRPGGLLALAYIGCLSHPLFDWMNSYGIRLLEPYVSRWFYGDALFIIDPWLWAMLIAGVWLSRRREKAGQRGWTRPAWYAIVGGLAYVGMNLGISAYMVDRYPPGPTNAMVVANPLPAAFWRREVLWRDGYMAGSYDVSLFSGKATDVQVPHRHGMEDPRIWERLPSNPAARAFLFWSRMPVATSVGEDIVLRDQRFMRSPTASSFEVELKP